MAAVSALDAPKIIGGESWQALARGFKDFPYSEAFKLIRDCSFCLVVISREDLGEAVDCLKDIWETTRDGFKVFNDSHWQYIGKWEYDWENAWTRLK